ncbi:MAG: arginine N-succinyltransferase, partial [Proteobacteria bacterium]|nr:arginine N-succinyltransferase [Pseudomonadota bacterium]
NFQDADRFNATHGHQFIADLFPKHPIYVAMLTESARSVIGLPHPSGRAAMRMLESEGFAFEKYIDIFDGGPTMTARTDRVKSIAEAKTATVVATDDDGGDRVLAATGRLSGFRCAFARLREAGGGVVIDRAAAAALGVGEGSEITHIGRA